MKRIQKNRDFVFGDLCDVLNIGGLVMHPTETCYGLAVDIFNENAVKRLYEVKGMAQDKPTSILVDGLGMAQEYGVFSEKALELAQKYWPGPLSIVVPRTRKLPGFFNPGHDFVSIRCSSDDFCLKMVKDFGKPVTTTSANRAGESPLYEPDLSVFGEFEEKIDLLVDGGKISQNKPSTIVKVNGDRVEVLRHGSVLLENS